MLITAWCMLAMVSTALRLKALPAHSLLVYLHASWNNQRFWRHLDLSQSQSKATILRLLKEHPDIWAPLLARGFSVDGPTLAGYLEAIADDEDNRDSWLSPTILRKAMATYGWAHRSDYMANNVNDLLNNVIGSSQWHCIDWVLLTKIETAEQLVSALDLLLPTNLALQTEADLVLAIRRLCHAWGLLAGVRLTQIGRLDRSQLTLTDIMGTVQGWQLLMEIFADDSLGVEGEEGWILIEATRALLGCIQRLYDPSGLFAVGLVGDTQNDWAYTLWWMAVSRDIAPWHNLQDANHLLVQTQSNKELKHRQLLMLGTMFLCNKQQFPSAPLADFTEMILTPTLLSDSDLLWMLACLNAAEPKETSAYIEMLGHRWGLIQLAQWYDETRILFPSNCIERAFTGWVRSYGKLTIDLDYGLEAVEEPEANTQIFARFSLCELGVSASEWLPVAAKAVLSRLRSLMPLFEVNGEAEFKPLAVRHPLPLYHALELANLAFLLRIQLPVRPVSKLVETIIDATATSRTVEAAPALLLNQIVTREDRLRLTNLDSVLTNLNDAQTENDDNECLQFDQQEAFEPPPRSEVDDDSQSDEIDREDIAVAGLAVWKKMVEILGQFRRSIAPYVTDPTVITAVLRQVFPSPH